MRKMKKCLAMALSVAMLLGSVSQIGHEPKAAAKIADMPTSPLVIGKQYTLCCDVDMQYEYEGTYYTYDEETNSYYSESKTIVTLADAIYKVTVPACAKLHFDMPDDAYVSFFNDAGNNIKYSWNTIVNGSAVEKDYIVAVNGYDTDFSFTTSLLNPMPDFEGQICVYSWNFELGERLEYFYEKYPEYSNYVKYVDLSMSGTGDEYREAVASLANASSTTSIVAADTDVIRDFIESGNYEPLSEIDFDVSRYDGTAYDYTIARGSWNGELYASAWQICPNNFIYDTKIAEEVLGTSVPEEVQAKIDSPEKFLEVAKQMKSAGYKMCNEQENIYYFITGANVDKHAGEIDSEVKSFYDSLVSNGYTVGALSWSDEWYAAMTADDVFGYFGCTWYTDWSHQFSDIKSVKTCQGPIDYSWGGTYLLANKKDKGNDIAKLVLETLCCDTEVMKNIMNNETDVVNNQTVVRQLIAEGKGTYDEFGGQNVYAVWDLAAKSIIKNDGWVTLENGECAYYEYGKQVKDKWVTGEDGEKRYINSDGVMVRDEFACDGTYTYYLQYDGSPMKDRLTYHPDGEHVIYFDSEGHEVFSDFANVKTTIEGNSVDDYCFFDVYGYLYVDVVTYDKEGKNLYYANPYGVLERGKWFQFSNTVKCADGTEWAGAAGNFGYANADGTLMVNTWTYDWEGRLCYMQGNGVALY